MCDYSLELYESRPARAGEVYVTSRFPSGSIGLTAPQDRETAICIACGTRLVLEGLNEETRSAFGISEMEEVVFAHMQDGLYRDGVAFANGVRVALNRLGVGVLVSLADVAPIAAKKEPEKKEPEAASPEPVEMEPAE
ncbi:hypothetical protein [Rhodoblastus sp.]|uniref:hypothetical protein n=1 Tax=Rhodoblastus sp. TaxID=1962975 RepID=UPI0035B2A18B